MNSNAHTPVENDLQLMEKLYKLGDGEGARMVAKRLLLTQTLSVNDKRRIKRVIEGTKPGFLSRRLLLFAIALLVVFYLYLRYMA